MGRYVAIIFRCLVCAAFMSPMAAVAQGEPAAAAAPADSNSIAVARDRVLPVVVSILTVRQDYRQGEPALSVASGSGTVISPQGHVATNAHVTQNGKSFRVVFADGHELPAKLVGTDTLSDIAVLQVESDKPEKFAYAEFATSLDLRAGDTVLAMGAPWGLSNSMSAGVVNNPRRLLVSLFDDEAEYEDSIGEDEPTGRYYSWIQHDAAIAPGNSGGPLVDLKGRIVGINTRGMITGGDLAFAIPGPDAAHVVDILIRKGHVDRVAMGFRLRSLKGSGYQEGVLINAVQRDSEADKAGLQAGDRLLRLNGEAMTALQPIDVPALQRYIAELPINSTVRLEIDRDGKTKRIELPAKAQPRDRGAESAFVPFGISISELTPAMSKRRHLDSSQGLLITGVRPGGPAAVARPELSVGDVIRKVNGQVVDSSAELARLTSPESKKPLVVAFESNGEQRLSLLTPEFGDHVRTPLPELPQAWVGVDVQPITASLAHEIGMSNAGYRIARLYPGSPLGKAGAKIGDLLLAIDNDPLKPNNETSSEGFDLRVRDLTPGSKARFSAIRNTAPIMFDVTLAESPVDVSGLATLAVTQLRAQLRELGFYDRVAQQLPDNRTGVLIDGVESGGAAGLAHLQRGDVVISVGDQPVSSPTELVRALDKALAEPGDGLIPLQVIRGSETRILYLERYWLKADASENQ
jgi:serine protease Do